jgi:SET domain-containing protein
MKSKLRVNKIYVKKSPLHGYGVFAGKNFRKGDVLEQCYTLISRGGDKKLEDYYFDADGKYALLTGFGVIYNHADEPNADYKINVKTRIATIKADKAIRKGEEIFVSYGPAWFKSRGFKPIHHANVTSVQKKKRRTVKKKKLSKKRQN